MTNPMFNPQPNYSGVTIQIANPAVNLGNSPLQNQYGSRSFYPGECYCTNPSGYGIYGQQIGSVQNQNPKVGYTSGGIYGIGVPPEGNVTENSNGLPQQTPYNMQNVEGNVPQNGYYSAYPPQYYLNNYNYQTNPVGVQNGEQNGEKNTVTKEKLADAINELSKKGDSNKLAENAENGVNPLQDTDLSDVSGVDEKADDIKDKPIYEANSQEEEDMTKSQDIIEDLDARQAALEEEKKNTKKKNVVALTDEYIKSLENYLDNPNDEIRLMASKEILTRLDEDKDRYDDAALNALLNKMLQDPSKLIRIAALSAFSSQLASGNDYTVTLLHNIQQNPASDKEDVIQAADILLKRSAGVEVKNIPDPSVKDE